MADLSNEQFAKLLQGAGNQNQRAPARGPRYIDFNNIVTPLLSEQQTKEAKPSVDPVGWLRYTKRMLSKARCPERWQVQHALAAIPLKYRREFCNACEKNGANDEEWTTFETYITRTFCEAREKGCANNEKCAASETHITRTPCKAQKGIDAFFRLLQYPSINDIPTLDRAMTEVPMLGELARSPECTTALFVLVRLSSELQAQLAREMDEIQSFTLGQLYATAITYFNSRRNFI